MCKIMDDLIKKENEKVIIKTKKEFVISLLNSTTLSKSEIALNAKMTLAEVEEIAKEIRK